MRDMTSSIRVLAALGAATMLASCAATAAQPPPPRPTATRNALPTGYPRPLRDEIGIRRVAQVGSGMVRLVRDPGSSDLYYLTAEGDIYALRTQPVVSSTGTPAYSHTDVRAGDFVLGMAFGPDRALYVIGNQSRDKQNRCVIRKGTLTGGGDERTWTTLATTEFHPKSETNFDHQCNGLAVSPDNMWLYFNSGSRTDHGEVQTAEGTWEGVREVPLTSAVFRVPANATDLVLPNDEAELEAKGYLFADGVRNAFDLEFNAAGDLIGVENGPDATLPDELNWLREGRHYGFPWRFGREDNPQQFPDYDASEDRRITDDFVAVQRGTYANDPAFPAPPTTFTDPIANLGPDADQFLDADGALQDASELGQPLYGVTAHRSPLGLSFDTANALSRDYRGGGFLLSWGAAGGPQTDTGQDLLLIRLKKAGDAYQMTAEQIVTGFDRPIDSALIGNRLYVLDNGGRGAIWELTFP
jgi:glucose/arabinose dehydrogenase